MKSYNVILASMLAMLAIGIPVGVMPSGIDCNEIYYASEDTPAVFSGIVTVDGNPAPLGTEIDVYVDEIYIDTILTGLAWTCSYPDGCEPALSSGGSVMCQETDAYVAYISGNDNWGEIQFYVNDHSVANVTYFAASTNTVDLHNPTGSAIVIDVNRAS